MANEKISQMPAISSFATGDLLPIVDVSEISTSDQNKSVTFGELFRNVLGGSASAPSIAFTGDQNTGIYSPGADQVAISTGGSGRVFIGSTGTVNFTGAGTAGSTQAVSFNGSAPVNSLVVDSSGRLGVGTSSPSYLLDLLGSAPRIRVKDSSTGAAFHHFENNSGNFYLGIDNSTGGSLNAGNYARVIWSQGAYPLAFATNDTQRMVITSAGLVGIGTSSPSAALDVTGNSKTSTLQIGTNPAGVSIGVLGIPNQKRIYGRNAANSADVNILYIDGSNGMVFGPNDAAVIDSSGRLGIGTTVPSSALTINNDGVGFRIERGSAVGYFYHNSTASTADLTIQSQAGAVQLFTENGANQPIKFTTNGTERCRVDSSGRLLVGTSTARGNFFNASTAFPQLQIEGTNGNTCSLASISSAANSDGGRLLLAHQRSGSVGGNTILDNGDEIGRITFQGSDGSEFVNGAQIAAEVDGAPGANDLPSRLVFSTTADGASSPTERMRISQNGRISLDGNNQTTPEENTATNGITFNCASGSHVQFAKIGAAVAGFNRMTDDGTIIRLMQAGTEEGTISVSGTTVSYNGAHLSRWSQLPSGAERTEILRGSILSNIDEMCEWTDEENEQLNRMKVSDVEGDKNVSGVFQAWDDDDDTYTNDFYCAMTGDFIIRIAEGVTVDRGDLLMSAGDGTAKPQDDDIIRSKTIAKVTSTNVSCTYDDGSYCVPCVLMAC